MKWSVLKSAPTLAALFISEELIDSPVLDVVHMIHRRNYVDRGKRRTEATESFERFVYNTVTSRYELSYLLHVELSHNHLRAL